MNEMAILTNGLNKVFGDFCAVNDLSIHVPRGAVYGFLGKNGAGKTSTIKILLGLAKPTSGSAQVLGMDVQEQKVAILQRTSFVSERKSLYSTLTPTELVRFTRGFYPTWSDAKAKKYADVLEIPMNQRFGKLSHGNQTKVCLLLAFSQGADLLIMDEPTVGLDPVVVDQLLRILIEDAVTEGCTIFFSSHQLHEVEQIADRFGVIDQGKLLLEANLEDVKAEFRLIIAAGNSLPMQKTSQVLSVIVDGQFNRYVVRSNADGFLAELRQNGATVNGVFPLTLREIFLELVRKEQPCTSGNVGVTLEAVL